MTDGISHSEFGLPLPYKCFGRLFFEEISHPGAANCACPKFSDGYCVPYDMWGEWWDAIGLYRRAEKERQA